LSEEIRGESQTSGVAESGNLRDAFGRHGSCLQRDMVQMKSLIDDAVGNLTTNFAAITELTRSLARCLDETPLIRRGFVQTVLEETPPDERGRCAAQAREIERQSRSAVVNLQFHDMVSQLLGNMRSRIDALETAARLASGDAGASQQIRDALAQVSFLEQRKPIAQPVMKTGDIELF
jgi:hypothetical protein